MPRRSALQLESSFVPADVGQRLRRARQEKGLSLAQLGGDTLTRGFLSAVETGRSSMSLKALSYVADRLNLPITYFLDGEEQAPALVPELQLDDAEEALRRGRPSDALQVLAGLSEPSGLRWRKLWLQGWALHSLGRARDAIPVLQEALPLADATGDERQAILVEYVLATALYGATNYDEALTHLSRAHGRTMELHDEALLGKITVAIGHVYLAQGQTDIALAQYVRARELFSAVEDLDNLAAVYGGLSRLARQRGDLQSALRYSRLGLGIWEAKQNQREAAHELANMAARYDELGDGELARVTALEAVERAQQSHAPDIEALARSSLASAYLRLGKTDEAQVQAEAVQRLGLDPTDLGSIDTVIVLAKLAHGTGEHGRADALFQQALTGLDEIGRHGRYADVALAYSETLGERGDLAGALEYARRAAKALAARSV